MNDYKFLVNRKKMFKKLKYIIILKPEKAE
jgi:hypothetical protein